MPVQTMVYGPSGWEPFDGEGDTIPYPDPFELGVTKPTASNTGPRETPPAVSSGGQLNIDAPTTYEGVRFERFVVVRSAGVTFIDCEFVGPADLSAYSTNSRMLVHAGHANVSGLRFEHCKFRPQTISDKWNTAVYGHDFTLHRCDLSGVVDLVGVENGTGSNSGNVTVEGSYLHDLTYFCPYSAQSDNFSHNDCVQLHYKSGHRNVSIVGSTLEAFIDPTSADFTAATWSGTPGSSTLLSGHPGYGGTLAERGYSTAGLMMNISSSYLPAVIEGVTVDRCWLNGGKWGAINIGSNWTGTGHDLTITGNRWGRDFYPGEEWVLTKQSSFHLTGASSITDNKYEDTGESRNQGGGYGTWP